MNFLKTFVNVIKTLPLLSVDKMPLDFAWCPRNGLGREAFQVIRHATEKSYVCFVAVILKVFFVNLLAALNFANVF